MLFVDGEIHQGQELGTIFFGAVKPLAYVLNPKAACTLLLHFLFFANHNYRYFDVARIHSSRTALFRLEGAELDARVLQRYYALSPESFTVVRDPLRRFVSAFNEKILQGYDSDYLELRDAVTSHFNVDLSPEADPARSCLAFAHWAASDSRLLTADLHFRPQSRNIKAGSRFRIDTVLRLEDREAVLAFFSRWIGPEKARWFTTLDFNVQKYSVDDFISDELRDVVRHLYAEDYERFYPDLN
jgi:hypothetical protein